MSMGLAVNLSLSFPAIIPRNPKMFIWPGLYYYRSHMRKSHNGSWHVQITPGPKCNVPRDLFCGLHHQPDSFILFFFFFHVQ